MTCILPQSQLAFEHFSLVKDSCSSLGLTCNLDNNAPVDTSNISYVVYSGVQKKIQLQIGKKFRLTVLEHSKKSYDEKLAILRERFLTESWSESPIIIS